MNFGQTSELMAFLMHYYYFRKKLWDGMEWRRMDWGDETDERQGEDHVYRKNRTPCWSRMEEVNSTA